jgi:hypothetical protein
VVTTYNIVRESLGGALTSYRPTMNVYHHIPRTLVPPAAIVQPRPTRTVSYLQAQSSGMAEWYFTIIVVIGLVDEKASQDMAGEIISPGSPLIVALQNVTLPSGFVTVTEGAIAEMSVGEGLYTHVQLAVTVLT